MLIGGSSCQGKQKAKEAESRSCLEKVKCVTISRQVGGCLCVCFWGFFLAKLHVNVATKKNRREKCFLMTHFAAELFSRPSSFFFSFFF